MSSSPVPEVYRRMHVRSAVVDAQTGIMDQPVEVVTVADLRVFDRILVGCTEWTMDCISGRRLVMHLGIDAQTYRQCTIHYGPTKQVVRIIEPWNQKEEDDELCD